MSLEKAKEALARLITYSDDYAKPGLTSEPSVNFEIDSAEYFNSSNYYIGYKTARTLKRKKLYIIDSSFANNISTTEAIQFYQFLTRQNVELYTFLPKNAENNGSVKRVHTAKELIALLKLKVIYVKEYLYQKLLIIEENSASFEIIDYVTRISLSRVLYPLIPGATADWANMPFILPVNMDNDASGKLEDIYRSLPKDIPFNYRWFQSQYCFNYRKLWLKTLNVKLQKHEFSSFLSQTSTNRLLDSSTITTRELLNNFTRDSRTSVLILEEDNVIQENLIASILIANPQITELTLANNNDFRGDMFWMGQRYNLQNLHLSNLALPNIDIIKAVAQSCPELKVLTIKNCILLKESTTKIANLHFEHLEEFSFSLNPATAKEQEDIQKYVTFNDLFKFMQQHHKLRKCEILFNSDWEADPEIDKIPCSTLETLNVRYHFFSFKTVYNIITKYPSLKHLAISGCSYSSEEEKALDFDTDLCLESLYFRNEHSEELQKILRRCPSFTTLKITKENYSYTDVVHMLSCPSMQNLQNLTLGIYVDSMEKINFSLTKLNSLTLSLSLDQPDTVDSLFSTMPNLTNLSVIIVDPDDPLLNPDFIRSHEKFMANLKHLNLRKSKGAWNQVLIPFEKLVILLNACKNLSLLECNLNIVATNGEYHALAKDLVIQQLKTTPRLAHLILQQLSPNIVTIIKNGDQSTQDLNNLLSDTIFFGQEIFELDLHQIPDFDFIKLKEFLKRNIVTDLKCSSKSLSPDQKKELEKLPPYNPDPRLQGLIPHINVITLSDPFAITKKNTSNTSVNRKKRAINSLIPLNTENNNGTPSYNISQLFNDDTTTDAIYYREHRFCDLDLTGNDLKMIFTPKKNKRYTYLMIEVVSNEELETRRFNMANDGKPVKIGNDLLSLEPGVWQKLPSNSPHIAMLAMNTDLEVRFDNTDAFLEVRLPATVETTQTINFAFLIQYQIRFYSQQALPGKLLPYQQEIAKLRFNQSGELAPKQVVDKIRQLNSFEIIQLLSFHFPKLATGKLKDNLVTAVDKINAIFEQAIGSCHVKSACVVKFARALGVEVYGTLNIAHCFVEYQHLGQTILFDLGGLPGSINFSHPYLLLLKPQQSAITPQVTAKKIISDRVLVHENADINALLDELYKQIQRFPKNYRNIFIVVPDGMIVDFHAALLKYYVDHHQKCEYISSLDEIRQYSAVARDRQLQKHMSTTAKFLATAQENDGLIIDFSDYSRPHIGINSSRDHVRRIKNMMIPTGVMNIGLIPKSKCNSIGIDLSSRTQLFAEALVVPPRSECPVVPDITAVPNTIEIIGFYNQDWKSTLFGKLNHSPQGFAHMEGGLLRALNNHKTSVVFHNAPWFSSDFNLKYNELSLLGCFPANGQVYHLPKNFIARNDQPFTLHMYCIEPVDDVMLKQTIYPLNSETLKDYIHYKYLADKKPLDFQGGIFAEKHPNNIIYLYVTETLNNTQWASILNNAIQQKIKLRLFAPENVSVPNELKNLVKIMSFDDPNHPHQVIYTNDPDLAFLEIKAKYPQALRISVHEGNSYTQIIGPLKEASENKDFTFDHQIGHILNLLLADETLVLTDNLPKEVLQRLESLFLPDPFLFVYGTIVRPPGRLILATYINNMIIFKKSELKIYKMEDRWKILATYQNDIRLFEKIKMAILEFEKKSNYLFIFGQIKIMLDKINANNLSNPIAPFFRLHPNPQLKLLAKKVWQRETPKRVASTAEEFFALRREKIKRQQASSRYTFIVGPSGSGKSEYFYNEADNSPANSFYFSLSKLDQYAQSDKKNNPTLCVDEANTYRPGELEDFAGLYDTIPKLGLNRILSKNHQLVLLGNYSTEMGRHYHKFCAQFGNQISLKEFPNFVLINTISLPSLNRAVMLQALQYNAISNLFLNMYHAVNAIAHKKILTSRNLKGMAFNLRLYVERYCQLFSEEHRLLSMATMASWDEVAGQLTKSERQALRVWVSTHTPIGNQFKAIKQAIKNSHTYHYPDFHVTKQTKNAQRLIKDMLFMRELKQRDANLRDFQLPILLYEGQSGAGKTEAYLAELEAQNYSKLSLAEDNSKINKEKSYYHIVSDEPASNNAATHRAVQEDVLLVVDEFNAVCNEETNNCIHSGRNIDGKKLPLVHFSIFASQNDNSTSQRSRLPDPVLKRSRKLWRKDVTEDELAEILTFITEDPILAKKLAADHTARCLDEVERNLPFRSSPRNAIIEAKTIVAQRNAMASRSFKRFLKDEDDGDKQQESKKLCV